MGEYISFIILQIWGQDHYENSMWKSMIVNKDFLTQLLINWQHSREREHIGSGVRKSLFADMDFNILVKQIDGELSITRWIVAWWRHMAR